MFCYHCQEAKKNVFCDTTGICGKSEDVADLQDLLMFALKGLAFFTDKAGDSVPEPTRRFMMKALYAMATNVNFDPAEFVSLIKETVQRREALRQQLALDSVPAAEEIHWHYDEISAEAFAAKGATVGVQSHTGIAADVLGLQESLLYACKGLAGLATQAYAGGCDWLFVSRFIDKALSFTLNPDNSVEACLTRLNEAGAVAQQMMGVVDRMNTANFGNPEPATVHLDTWNRPGILVTGCDLNDLDDLLAQSEGSGVDVYTHGEMIAAHGYPAFKKYFHLVGNYGNAWQEQRTEFGKFNGPILVTSHSIQQQKPAYKDKIYTSGTVGWPEVSHVDARKTGKRKDFSALIEQAKQCKAPDAITAGQWTTGYGRKALEALVPTVAAALQSGEIKRIVVLAGSDGRHKERRYYSQLAESLPADVLILTAGDLKYRFINHDFGTVAGISRLLDAGQTQDIYALIQFLGLLQQALGLASFADLPVSFNIAWYEQRTLLLVLALLNAGAKNLRLGPTLPPFFNADVLAKLESLFGLKGIDSVENDIAAMLQGQ